MALVGDLFNDVFFVGGMHDVEIGKFRIPETESVVVAGDKGDVFHPGVFGHGHPFSGIEFNRVEEIHQAAVVLHFDVLVVHHPFAVTGDTEWTPMDKEAEFIIAELLPGLQVFRSRRVGLRPAAPAAKDNHEEG